jgi:hypothetical protein
MNTYEYQKLRGLKRKLELIKLKGGKCKKCGYDINVAALDFHHTNPNEKEIKLDVRKLSNTKMSKLIKEANKCDLLCANCHRETHHPDLELINLDKMLENINEKVLSIRTINKPKCIDCGIEINYGYQRCNKCSSISKRKVCRPPYEQLIKEINETNYVVVGKKYGVADNTIRKWVRFYEN